MSRLTPPATVLEIADDLERAGFEAWCVGGAVRDALLGRPHLDWDLATSATPPEVRGVFGMRRTIPVGVDFGTVGVLDRHGRMHEVTTFRRDVRTDGRHAEVEFGVSLEDDLARRDFTINAIAYSPRRDEIRDPFGGQIDLSRGVVRAVGDPEARMQEDRLRALRGIRFAARFGFRIEESTRRAIDDSAPFLGRLSRERVKQELDKTLEQVLCPSIAFTTWKTSGALRALIPVLDRPGTTFVVPDFVAMPGPLTRPARRAIRLAGLLVDHPAEAAQVLTDLRAARVEIQLVAALVERWRTFGGVMGDAITADPPPPDRDVRQWTAGIGRLYVSPFMRLASGVWASRRGGQSWTPSASAIHSLYRRMLRCAFGDPIDLGSLAVDGDDLRRIGIAPGPGLGKILQALLAEVVAEPQRNTTDWLLHEAAKLDATTRRDAAARIDTE